ncbi:MAG: hypothetical protein GXZ11_01680 [Tissierellia bacterium]|nr:hypothetical protein [Tissierellia bacterium]
MALGANYYTEIISNIIECVFISGGAAILALMTIKPLAGFAQLEDVVLVDSFTFRAVIATSLLAGIIINGVIFIKMQTVKVNDLLKTGE